MLPDVALTPRYVKRVSHWVVFVGRPKGSRHKRENLTLCRKRSLGIWLNVYMAGFSDTAKGSFQQDAAGFSDI